MSAAALMPALLGLAACKSAAERADELASQAQGQIEAGDLAAARQTIDEAIMLRDDQARYHELRGVAAARLDDPVEAYRSFQRVLEFDASNRNALAYVASLGVQLGQLNDADEAADRLLTLTPDALPALQVKGMIALSREHYDDATRFADRILAARPTDEGGAVIKARALVKSGQPEAGLQWIDGALARSPKSFALLSTKLNIYRFLKQAEPMAPVIAQLVAQSPDTPAFRLDQANLLYTLGRIDEARQAGVALLTKGARDPANYGALHRLWWQYDREPLSDAAAATAASWEDPIAVATTVRYLLWRGDLRHASIILRDAPTRYGRHTDPLRYESLRARLLMAGGRAAEAREKIDEILKQDANDVDALLLRAQVALAEGKLDLALESAQAALTNDPQNPELYVMLGRVHQARGSEARARQMFEDGIKTAPQSPYLVEQYGRYLAERGDRQRAVSLARSFARDLPSLPRAWELLGSQCRAVGDQGCLATAAQGYQAAKTAYLVDDPPGRPPNRGLFGRL